MEKNVIKKPTFKTEVTVENLNKAYNKDELVDLVVMLYGLVEMHENCAERADRIAKNANPVHVRVSQR